MTLDDKRKLTNLIAGASNIYNCELSVNKNIFVRLRNLRLAAVKPNETGAASDLISDAHSTGNECHVFDRHDNADDDQGDINMYVPKYSWHAAWRWR